MPKDSVTGEEIERLVGLAKLGAQGRTGGSVHLCSATLMNLVQKISSIDGIDETASPQMEFWQARIPRVKALGICIQ